MLLALGDGSALLIKLASRLQQARNMKQMPAHKRNEFVRITECVFLPMANRLGIWSLKAELEDLCFEVSLRQHANVTLFILADDVVETISRVGIRQLVVAGGAG